MNIPDWLHEQAPAARRPEEITPPGIALGRRIQAVELQIEGERQRFFLTSDIDQAEFFAGVEQITELLPGYGAAADPLPPELAAIGLSRVNVDPCIDGLTAGLCTSLLQQVSGGPFVPLTSDFTDLTTHGERLSILRAQLSLLGSQPWTAMLSSAAAASESKLSALAAELERERAVSAAHAAGTMEQAKQFGQIFHESIERAQDQAAQLATKRATKPREN